MKKVLSVVLAVVMVCSVGLISVLAESEPLLIVKSDTTSASVGDEVVVRVELSEKSNLGVLTFDLKYDVQSFEYVPDSVVLGNIFSVVEVNPDLDGCIRFAGITTSSVNEGGSLIVAKFKVLKTDGEFILNVDEACDGEDNDVTTAVAENAVSSVVIKCAHSNINEEIIKVPTCFVAGESVIICVDCGVSVSSDVIPAKGHTYSEWVIVEEATNTEKGFMARCCENCGLVEKKIIDIVVDSPVIPDTDTSFVDSNQKYTVLAVVLTMLGVACLSGAMLIHRKKYK